MAILGLLSPEFPAASLAENLDAIAATGAIGVQFDCASAGRGTFPDALSDRDAAELKKAFASRGLRLSALSGTYNMIDPNPVARQAGADNLNRLIAMAPRLGAGLVTLCTGTRDPLDMWRRHEASDRDDAWADLLASTEIAVRDAEEHGVVLGVETEVSNCVSTVAKARRLLDAMKSPALKIIMDGANIFQRGQLPRMRAVIDEAFDLLGADIVLAHAKDLDRDGEAGHVPAGLGKLDYPYYLSALKRSGFDGAIILHALRPEQAEERLAFVRGAAPNGYLQ